MLDHVPLVTQETRSDPNEHEQRAYRRLLLEAAVDEGYLVRLQKRVGIGRFITRVVQPVTLQPDEGGESAGVLVTRLLGTREASFPLDQIDEVSIAADHLPIEQVRRGGLAVGDPVAHPQFGFGVVQAFRASGEHTRVLVRFEKSGVRILSLQHVRLRVCNWNSEA
jgi:hypothetical protein